MHSVEAVLENALIILRYFGERNQIMKLHPVSTAKIKKIQIQCCTVFNEVSRLVLVAVLCSAIALPIQLWPTQSHADSSPTKADLINAPLPDYAQLAGQRRIHQNPDGTQVVYHLDQPDINLEPVAYTDFRTGVQINWDLAASEFSFTVLQGAHKDIQIISGMKVTGSPTFNADASYLYIPTTDGVRVLVTKHFKQTGFIAPVSPYLVAPLPSAVGKILELHVHHRSKDLSKLLGDTPHQLPGTLKAGDLLAKVEGADGAVKWIHYDVDNLQSNLAVQMLGVLIEMMILNPNAENIQAYSDFLKVNDRWVQKYRTNRNQLIDSGALDLSRQAIQRMSERSGTATQQQIFTEVRDLLSTRVDEFPKTRAASRGTEDALTRILSPESVTASAKAAARELDQLEFGVAGSQNTLAGRFASSVLGLWDRVAQPKWVLSLAAVLGGTVGYSYYQPQSYIAQIGAPMVQAVSAAWNGLLNSPWIGVIAKPEALKASADFFLNQAHLGAWLGGAALLSVGIYASTLVLGYGAGWVRHWITGRSAPDTRLQNLFSEMNRNLFEIMRDGYLWVNRLVEGVMTVGAGLGPLYKALSAEVPLSNPQVWKSTYLSSEQGRAHQAKQIGKQIEKEADVRRVALDLAAAVIVSESTGTPLSVLLLMGGSDAGKSTLDQLLSTPEGCRRLSETMVVARGVLLEALNDSDETLDPDQIRTNVDRFLKVAQKVQEEAKSNSASQGKLKRLFRATREFFSEDVLPVVLGKNARVLFRRYYGTRLHPTTLQQAGYMYGVDYNGSLGYFAVVAAQDISLPPAPRMVSGQVEQVLNYTAQNTADVGPSVDSAPMSRPTADRPFSDQFYDETTRPQTLFEGLLNVLTGWAKRPADEKGLLDFWHDWIGNLRDGWVTRTVFAVSTMYMTFQAKALMGTMKFDGPLDMVLASFRTGWVWLMQKMSVGYDFGTGSLLLGYATVWPMISSWMTQNKKIIAENLETLRATGSKIWRGIELNRPTEMIEGIQEMKALYAQSGLEIPEELNVPTAQYDSEKALKLLAYSRKVAPLPTGQNQTLYFLLNFVWGAGLSTIIYNTANISLTENPPSVWRLLAALGFISAAYVGSKAASDKVVKPAIAKVQPYAQRFMQGARDVKNRCVQVLMRRTPVAPN